MFTLLYYRRHPHFVKGYYPEGKGVACYERAITGPSCHAC